MEFLRKLLTLGKSRFAGAIIGLLVVALAFAAARLALKSDWTYWLVIAFLFAAFTMPRYIRPKAKPETYKLT